MEEKRNAIRVRMRAWTPASGYSSPPSPVSSQLGWDEGRDEDFQSQMDENGIIGLREAQGEADEVVLEKDEDMFSDVGTPEPEEGLPHALEDLSCHLSELLDSEPLSQPIGDDRLSPTHNDVEYSVSLEDWIENNDDDDDDDDEKPDEEDQKGFNIHRPFAHSRPDRDLFSGIMNNEIEEITMRRDESYPLQRNIDPQDNWIDSHDVTTHEGKDDENWTDVAVLETRTPSQNSCDERSHVSSSPSFKSASQTHFYPSLSEPSLQEEAENSRTDVKTFAESNSRQPRHSPRSYQPEEEPTLALSIFGSETGLPKLEQKSAGPRHNHHYHHQVSVTSGVDYPLSISAQSTAKDSTYRRRRHYRPSKTSLTDPDDVRKGQLSHPLPDFSKVEPRVRFPKSNYKPPKSRKPPHNERSKPEAPVVFKSPADIVREALSSNSAGPSNPAAPTDSQKPSNTTMPEELRCPLQAGAIMQQLQEDYNRLLTKYAEAENTIDRLRLEAKVSLYSDPPKPSQPGALSGVLKEGSKIMALSFPQAQRAELSTDAIQPIQQRLNSASRGTPPRPSSVDSVPSSWHRSPAAAPLTEGLSKQMAGFQLQVHEFEKLLKNRRLEPYEQTQGLSQLAQGQDSIERAYLAAREKHQQLQRQTGGRLGPFDPDRELESLIFQSGIQLEELKEWIEQSEQDQLVAPTLSDPPHAVQPCVSLKEAEPQPENPASAAHASDTVGLEVSSVSGESDGDGEKGEDDMLPSVCHPLNHKQHRVEKGFRSLMDHYQSFRDLSKLLDRDQGEVDHNSSDHSPHPARIDGMEIEQWRRSTNKRDSNKPLQPLPVSDALSGSSRVFNSMETLPGAPVPATPLPRKQGCGRRAAGSTQSQSSLGRRASKEIDGARRGQLQDGVVTPETDSGFMGSESSRLTPAAQSPVQQRAAVRATRPSVTQEKHQINPKSSSPAQTQPSSDPTGAHAIASGGAPGSSGRRGEARMRHIPSSSTSSSPLRWPSTPLQPWLSSESAHSLSEDGTGRGDQHEQPSNQDPSYLRSSSFTAPYHHGDHLKAQSSGQLANQHAAIESLQTEVNRLRERLEGSLRTSSPANRATEPTSSLKDIRDRAPRHTSTPHPRQRDFRSCARNIASKKEPRDTESTVKKEQERTIPRRRSASVPRLRLESETSIDSDHTQSEVMTPKHIPVSPMTAHRTQRSRAETRRPNSNLHTNRQKRSVSADRSNERKDEAAGRGRPGPLCLSCLARRSRTSGYQAKNMSSPCHTRYYTNHCPLCGADKTEAVPPPANHTFMQKETRLMQTGVPGVYLAVAPPPPVIGSVPMVQCVPFCASVLYLSNPVVTASYQKPVYIAPNEGKGYRGHRRRSQSLDMRHSLNRSLGRAIATASCVRDMSERMVHSLSSGLHRSSQLAKSCTY
ncbi:uncharacterized protein akna isoform 1-T1 [Clarias gariepinus]